MADCNLIRHAHGEVVAAYPSSEGELAAHRHWIRRRLTYPSLTRYASCRA